jgi:heterodisulfide reductase subunit A
MKDSALVIGSGIAGIQAALDLADNGVKVYVVEKAESIGGKMAQLDKTFPTLDCSMCTMGPKMVDVSRHPNIELLTLSEVIGLKGEAGNFDVKVKKKSRFVDVDKCTGCGLCAEACVWKKIPDEYNGGLSMRSAIYIKFPQAIPLKATVDPNNCLWVVKGKCGKKCVAACEAKAIDFDQKDEVVELNVGSVIVASGMKVFDPTVLEEYGYGKYPDILTSLEFERMLSATGPTQGELVKTGDGEVPGKIVFVQCVGSRDTRNFPYCSRVCCTYSIKQSLLAKDHVKDLDITILYMDIRAYGKGFDRFYDKAVNEGIRFLRGRPSRVSKDNGGLRLKVEDTGKGSIEELDADMVVLATAIIPPDGAEDLASVLGIERDEYGFFKEDVTEPLKSSKEGIYLCGTSTGPKDISESVALASGAVSQALRNLTPSFEEKEEIPPLELEPEPRIGVFVCRCGTNIASVVDVPHVTEHSSTISNVVYSREELFACSSGAQKEISSAIKEHNLNRVIVAACSPRTHGPIFMKACEDAGLNPYLFEMVNIRNQNSWVHRDNNSATKKAKKLVELGIAKSRLLEPLTVKSSSVIQKALVIGGGIAGINSAIALSRLGIKTSLVEKESELGGRLRKLHKLAPLGIDAKEVLASKIKELESSGVDIHLNDEIENVGGYVGNFEVTLASGKNLSVGCIIMATGAELYKPGEYGYGNDKSVITNLELESRFPNIEEEKVTFVSCIGSRDGERECSRYCCQTMIHQALELNEMGKKVRVLYKDIRTFGKGAEELYAKALEKGILFLRYKEPPEYKDGAVKVFDELSGTDVNIPTDLLVLVLGMAPSENGLAEILKLPKSEDGYLMELHPKLGPVEMSSKGIFLAGTAQGPKDIKDSISQALATASKASAIIKKDSIELEPIVASVMEAKCRWCARCTETCEFDAIQMVEVDSRKVAVVNEVLCRGCGACTVVCPTGAMDIANYSHAQISAMIDALE